MATSLTAERKYRGFQIGFTNNTDIKLVLKKCLFTLVKRYSVFKDHFFVFYLKGLELFMILYRN